MTKEEAKELLSTWNVALRLWRDPQGSLGKLLALEDFHFELRRNGLRWFNEVAEGK